MSLLSFYFFCPALAGHSYCASVISLTAGLPPMSPFACAKNLPCTFLHDFFWAVQTCGAVVYGPRPMDVNDAAATTPFIAQPEFAQRPQSVDGFLFIIRHILSSFLHVYSSQEGKQLLQKLYARMKRATKTNLRRKANGGRVLPLTRNESVRKDRKETSFR